VEQSIPYPYQLAHLNVNNPDEGKANVYPDNVLSVSHIETTGGTCTFCGVDGAEVVTQYPGPGTVNLGGEEDVGPPQTVVFAVCT
jgi:hypothetical protein